MDGDIRPRRSSYRRFSEMTTTTCRAADGLCHDANRATSDCAPTQCRGGVEAGQSDNSRHAVAGLLRAEWPRLVVIAAVVAGFMLAGGR